MSAQLLERVDVKELCQTMLETHLDAATDKFIDLGLKVSPVYLSGQAWLLRELPGNLVDNALNYTPVLERFYRVQGTLSEGNGLGLAIAEEIARAHHSQSMVSEGAGGRGTKITLVFPL